MDKDRDGGCCDREANIGNGGNRGGYNTAAVKTAAQRRLASDDSDGERPTKHGDGVSPTAARRLHAGGAATASRRRGKGDRVRGRRGNNEGLTPPRRLQAGGAVRASVSDAGAA